MEREERRGFLRIDESVPISYHRLREISAITTKTLDISGGGIKIVCAEPLSIGEIVQIKLDIPTRKSPIFCTGKIVWTKKETTEDKIKNFCGISFIDIHSKDREDIVEYVFFKNYKLQEEKNIAISISNLIKKHNKVVLLDNINLQIKQGEVFILFSRNQSERTMLLKILSTLALPTSGEIKILGYNISSCKNQVKKLIGYMPDVSTLYPSLSLRENLFHFAKKYGIRKEDIPDVVEELLAFTNLSSEGDRLCGSISSSLKQQLIFAISILNKPQVLILNEPTKNFTKSYIPFFWECIRKLSKNKVTVIISTDKINDIDFSDKSAVIDNGKIVAYGMPQEIKNFLESKYKS